MMIALDCTAVAYAIAAEKLDPVDRADERKLALYFRDYVNWLKTAQRETLIIPAPAFAEFLAFYSTHDQQASAVAAIRSGFVVSPMDTRAAMLAGEYRVRYGDNTFMKVVMTEDNISKQCVKTDVEIVATAVAHGAAKIIAADKGIHRLATLTGVLEPVHPRDCKLPEEKPSGRGSLFPDEA